MLKKRLNKYFNKRKHHVNGHEPNVRIYCDRTRKAGLRYINPKHLPVNVGTLPRDFDKFMILNLNCDNNGVLRVIDVPRKVGENQMPTDLYMALNCEEEVNETYHMPTTVWEKIPYAILGILLFVELIVIFLITSSL